MSDPFIGEIRIFAGNFAPRNWAFCDGQLLGVSQNSALFFLLGTVYGGDGTTSFGLPDMRGRIPVDAGIGPGLTQRRPGEKGGAEQVTLTSVEMPSHMHDLNANTQPATAASPQGKVLADGVGVSFFSNGMPIYRLASSGLTDSGGSQPHSNLMPSLCVNFIIALSGIYPEKAQEV